MSTRQPKTASGHQKKSQNKADRPEETEDDANKLATQTLETADILEAIAALKDDFGTKFDGVMTAINGIKSDIKDFSGRLGQQKIGLVR
ncbi:hypothetical protein PBY51_020347 [Eleginops maclovinus]|uniref:Uncharacterized protein n=1 Tax=Eleginops maclovinus TaxID=56733 RepID=A0AAN7XMC0_ELEMC|nr:hypothetical protein PBY51_020347 [Eleginops maclovinus]